MHVHARAHTSGKGKGGGGEAGGVAEVARNGGARDGADDGWPQDGDRELGAVQLRQQLLAHVLGQRVAVGQVHILQQLLGLRQSHHACVSVVSL